MNEKRNITWVSFLFQDFLKYSKKANLDTTELEVLKTFSLTDRNSFNSELLLFQKSLSFSDLPEKVIISVYILHFPSKATISNETKFYAAKSFGK